MLSQYRGAGRHADRQRGNDFWQRQYAAGATLNFNQAADASYAGIVSGAGAVSKTGAGALTHRQQRRLHRHYHGV